MGGNSQGEAARRMNRLTILKRDPLVVQSWVLKVTHGAMAALLGARPIRLLPWCGSGVRHRGEPDLTLLNPPWRGWGALLAWIWF